MSYRYVASTVLGLYVISSGALREIGKGMGYMGRIEPRDRALDFTKEATTAGKRDMEQKAKELLERLYDAKVPSESNWGRNLEEVNREIADIEKELKSIPAEARSKVMREHPDLAPSSYYEKSLR